MTTLPIIDYNAPNAPTQFVQSLRETGFAVLQNTPLLPSTIESLLNDWQAFFLHVDKAPWAFDAQHFDGYFAPSVSETAKGQSVKDLKEFYHYYPWGRAPESLRVHTQDYYERASALASQLLNWVQQHSPTEVAQHYSQPLSQMIEGSEQTLLRILHYPPLRGDEPMQAIRAAAHEDINLLTLLPASSEAGLQVLGTTEAWLDVPCGAQLLIINIGDMLQEASGGYFPSTTHRVINPQGAHTQSSRLSLPLFLHPRPNVVLSDRYTARTYLDERLRELGMKS